MNRKALGQYIKHSSVYVRVHPCHVLHEKSELLIDAEGVASEKINLDILI